MTWVLHIISFILMQNGSGALPLKLNKYIVSRFLPDLFLMFFFILQSSPLSFQRDLTDGSSSQ